VQDAAGAASEPAAPGSSAAGTASDLAAALAGEAKAADGSAKAGQAAESGQNGVQAAVPGAVQNGSAGGSAAETDGRAASGDAGGEQAAARAVPQTDGAADAAAMQQQAAATEAEGEKAAHGARTARTAYASAAAGQAPAPAAEAGPAGSAAQADGPAAARPGQTGAGVADQVAESIRASGGRTDREIEVRLHPPELGRLRITLRSDGEAVRGVVRVEVPETAARLQQEAAPLLARLQADGIDVRRLDVVLNQNSQGGTGGQTPAFRQGQGSPDAWGSEPGDYPYTPAGHGFEAAAEGDATAEAAGGRGLSLNVQV
jgi:flagellar hook-length control protein FliK